MTQSDIKDDVRQVPAEEDDHDKFAHYVNKDRLMEAIVDAIPLVALCGKVWVPTRDGLKFAVCPECQEVYNTLKDE